MTIDFSRIAADLRQLGGLGSIAGSLPTTATTGLPWWMRLVMFILGAGMFYLEHQNAASPTTTTPPHPVTTTISSPATGVTTSATTSANTVLMPPAPPQGNLGSPHAAS